MRLIYRASNQEEASQIGHALSKESIPYVVEPVEDEEEGEHALIAVWIIDEEDIRRGQEIVECYQNDPSDPLFSKSTGVGRIREGLTPSALFKKPIQPQIAPDEREQLHSDRKSMDSPSRSRAASVTYVTWYILFACVLLYVWDNFHQNFHAEREVADLPYPSLVTSPVKRGLMYDYPEAFTYLEKVVSIYAISDGGGGEALDELNKKREELERKFLETPWWKGFYPIVVDTLKGESTVRDQGPLIEKIREGEVWRLVTPILLHYDIFHIGFNMIWLITLGLQIEWRLGALRYLLLILTVGIFSNTCQYLMSGPTFLGFSGVLCGMFAFIWVRQLTAPWEGYQLDARTRTFLFFVLMAMVAVQCFGFFFEVLTGEHFGIAIANTAHLSGALMGYFLAKMGMFARS